MKPFAMIWLTFIFFSCHQAKNDPDPLKVSAKKTKPAHKGDSILINIMQGGEGVNVDSCVYVSFDLEKDSTYNRQLREYLCYNIMGHTDYPAQDSLPFLVSRESFLRMILLFYNGNKYTGIKTGFESYQMGELRQGYLWAIRDCCVERLQTIADAMLQQDEFDGVNCLWGKADLSKLPSLKGYLGRMDTANFHYDAEIAVLFHNTRKDSMSNVYMAKAAKLPTFKEEYHKLKTLMKKPIVDQGKYDLAIYGEYY